MTTKRALCATSPQVTRNSLQVGSKALRIRTCLGVALVWIAISSTGCVSWQRDVQPESREPGTAVGFVFVDKDGDGLRSDSEPGVSGVRVSNGRQVVLTDRDGRYQLPVGSDAGLFVVKPTGMRTQIDDRNLPRFYYLHKPTGSPAYLTYPGVPPTGPLPESVDFPLYRQRERSPFRVLVLGDPQPKTIEELNYFSHDVLAELPRDDIAFGITLGDIVDNDLSLYDPLTQAMRLVGVPWYHVLGNHDLNLDAPSDRISDATFERVFGPSTYAFEYANVHFIVVDDIEFRPASAAEDREAGYRGAIVPQQLEFIEAYVGTVPVDERIVLLMHIPLIGRESHQVGERQALYKILERHHYTQSISAHTHMQFHAFLGPEDGNHGALHHHWNSPTSAGSWWRGRRDERGIPHATQRDGSPNGYSIVSFDGTDYSIRFNPAHRPPSYQMHIQAPDEVSLGSQAAIWANVFAGSARSQIEMRIVDPDSEESVAYEPMQLTRAKDPGYIATRTRESASPVEGEFALPHAAESPHLWKAQLPAGLPIGTYWIEVKSTDMFGQIDHGRRVIRIVDAQAQAQPAP